MKKILMPCLVLSLLSLNWVGCGDDDDEKIIGGISHALYVLNEIPMTVSVVDLDEDTLVNDVVPVGEVPNQLVYRDGKLYCVNSGTDDISIYEVENWMADTPIHLPDGANPMSMVFYDDNTAYVTANLTNKVLKVDIPTKTVTAEIDVGLAPAGITLSSGKVYASNTAFDGGTFTYGQGTVTVIDGASGEVTGTIDVAVNPFAVTTAPDGKVHVSCTGNYFSAWGRVYIIDPATDTVVDSVLTEGSPGRISISETNNFAYLAVWGKGALVYNTLTLSMVNDTSDYFYGQGGSGVLADMDGNIFLADWSNNNVVRLDADGTVLATYEVSGMPSAMARRYE